MDEDRNLDESAYLLLATGSQRGKVLIYNQSSNDANVSQLVKDKGHLRQTT